MRRLPGKAVWVALAVAASTVTAACDDFLEVDNPNSLEAEGIDEERDRGLLSRSAYQDFAAQNGNLSVYVAWFTNEARVGDTFPTRNEFGRRDVVDTNGTFSGLWNSLHDAIQFAERTSTSIEAAGNNIDLARAYFASGFGILQQAEMFCEGTLADGPLEPRGPMTTVELLDAAIERLTNANTVAKGLTGSEASDIASGALVGIARAHLQAGRKQQASQFAGQVPESFEYNVLHLDDPSNRRLGNDIWSFSESRISLVVGPEWRAMADAGDPRIAYVDMKRVAQDGVLNFFRQDKVKSFADPDRLASGLEARYIKVEADGNAAAMLAFINERRAAGNQAPISTTSMDALMTELMEQKARDFWLEGKRIGDLRRNPDNVPYIIPTGDNYYKPELGLVGSQTCWPVPQSEKRNNPEWPTTG